MVIPGVRQTLYSVGMVSLVLLGLVALGLVGFGVYRLATPGRTMRPVAANVFVPPTRVSGQTYVAEESKSKRPPEPPQISPPSSSELIQQLHSMDWFQFEKLVGHVYRKLGYAVTRRGGANADGGIDLVIEKDGQSTAVQCKQWRKWKVGVKAVRELLGALKDVDIENGIFITLLGCTEPARPLAQKHGIEIVNEAGLIQMLESTDARFDPEVLELLRDSRKFCPKCESELVIRVAKKGSNLGSKFWGCSTYPRCNFTLPIG